MLRELAALRGSSISALVREGVETIIAPARAERQSRIAAALEAIGAFDSGLPDVGTRHDDYLADALVERLKKRRKRS